VGIVGITAITDRVGRLFGHDEEDEMRESCSSSARRDLRSTSRTNWSASRPQRRQRRNRVTDELHEVRFLVGSGDPEELA
jgi:hypothetical protein